MSYYRLANTNPLFSKEKIMEQKIIERIKKMFALANDKGAAKGEADNAMRMATKLLERHNLSMIDLHVTDDISIKFEEGAINPWIRQVYSVVSRLYGCTYFYSSQQKTNYIVGTESDRVTASLVIQYLVEDIKKAGKGQGIDFKNGASLELAKTCHILMTERADSLETTETGLALVDIYRTKIDLAQAYMDEKLNLGKGRKANMRSSEAGRSFGRGLSPNARMSNKVAIG